MKKGVSYLPYTVMPFLVITAVKMPEIAEKYLLGATLIILHLFVWIVHVFRWSLSTILKAPLFSPQKRPWLRSITLQNVIHTSSPLSWRWQRITLKRFSPLPFSKGWYKGGGGMEPPLSFLYVAVFWNDFSFSGKLLIFLTRWGIF